VCDRPNGAGIDEVALLEYGSRSCEEVGVRGGRVVGFGDDRFEQFAVHRAGRFDDGNREALLAAGEEVVDRANGGTGRFGDLAERGAVVPVAPKQLVGRNDDPVAGGCHAASVEPSF
jgi:hypothetical protein